MPHNPAKLSTENRDENSRQVLFSGTVINAALTFVSRILGMLRDVATAALFGVSGSVVFDAFVMSFRMIVKAIFVSSQPELKKVSEIIVTSFSLAVNAIDGGRGF